MTIIKKCFLCIFAIMDFMLTSASLMAGDIGAYKCKIVTADIWNIQIVGSKTYFDSNKREASHIYHGLTELLILEDNIDLEKMALTKISNTLDDIKTWEKSSLSPWNGGQIVGFDSKTEDFLIQHEEKWKLIKINTVNRLYIQVFVAECIVEHNGLKVFTAIPSTTPKLSEDKKIIDAFSELLTKKKESN